MSKKDLNGAMFGVNKEENGEVAVPATAEEQPKALA